MRKEKEGERRVEHVGEKGEKQKFEERMKQKGRKVSRRR